MYSTLGGSSKAPFALCVLRVFDSSWLMSGRGNFFTPGSSASRAIFEFVRSTGALGCARCAGCAGGFTAFCVFGFIDGWSR